MKTEIWTTVITPIAMTIVSIVAGFLYARWQVNTMLAIANQVKKKEKNEAANKRRGWLTNHPSITLTLALLANCGTVASGLSEPLTRSSLLEVAVGVAVIMGIGLFSLLSYSIDCIYKSLFGAVQSITEIQVCWASFIARQPLINTTLIDAMELFLKLAEET